MTISDVSYLGQFALVNHDVYHRKFIEIWRKIYSENVVTIQNQNGFVYMFVWLASIIFIWCERIKIYWHLFMICFPLTIYFPKSWQKICLVYVLFQFHLQFSDSDPYFLFTRFRSLVFLIFHKTRQILWWDFCCHTLFLINESRWTTRLTNKFIVVSRNSHKWTGEKEFIEEPLQRDY